MAVQQLRWLSKQRIAVILALVIAVAGCKAFSSHVIGSGKIVTEEREIHDVREVILDGEGELVIEQGERESLLIKSDDNILTHIKTTVSDGVLKITPKIYIAFKVLQPTQPIRYHLFVKELSEITLIGHGEVQSNGPLKAKDLIVNVRGAGDIDLSLKVDSLSANSSGSAHYLLKGVATNQMINVSGSVLYDGADLKSQTTTVNISGEGTVKVAAEKKLQVNISGSGTIHYAGHPEIISSISGSGRVEALKE